MSELITCTYIYWIFVFALRLYLGMTNIKPKNIEKNQSHVPTLFTLHKFQLNKHKLIAMNSAGYLSTYFFGEKLLPFVLYTVLSKMIALFCRFTV